ncbi:MAG: lactate utilization protein [Candidatus Omnitrophica bacterium]|nr:lactate utilization protein [Candidatus Omnitrophota bacterium]
MNKNIENLFVNLKKRNIPAFYFKDRADFLKEILRIIPKEASIGFSGSQTLSQLGLLNELKERGNPVFDPYQKEISPSESHRIRREATQADFYLVSPNAISLEGEFIFFSAYGNRIAGVAYANKVLIISGINKITPDFNSAIKRAREYSTPLNCKRLNWKSACFDDGLCKKDICFLPEFKRMCSQILIIENEIIPERISLFLINENLGF